MQDDKILGLCCYAQNSLSLGVSAWAQGPDWRFLQEVSLGQHYYSNSAIFICTFAHEVTSANTAIRQSEAIVQVTTFRTPGQFITKGYAYFMNTWIVIGFVLPLFLILLRSPNAIHSFKSNQISTIWLIQWSV